MTYLDLWMILTEAEERVRVSFDEGVRTRSKETVSLCEERMAKEGITREQLRKLAGVK